ncbi:MAG: amidohydrolase [Deltaproteobacteria bacterium]|nr:amidohydrolase [Deltaproteobacteria bacterium]RLB20547.1 MAG: amidohydrolase [Deltaproteobacteria bacterium]
MVGNKKNYNIVIEGGTLLSMVDGEEPVDDARVVISGDKIKEVSVSHNNSLPETNEIVYAKDAIILPGLINTHCHSPMALFRGMADDLPLKSWLYEHIFPAEAKYISPDTVYWASLLASVEMIASGTTTCIDGYFFADEIVKALHKSGMRALVAQGVIDFPAPGVPDSKKNLDVASAFLQRWMHFSDRIIPGIFCHSPLTCSEKTLLRARDISTQFDFPLQIHLSETREEVGEIKQKSSLRPVFYLDELGLLNRHLIAAHAIYLNEEEIDLLAEKKVKIAHCPESNMKLGSGVAPIAQMLEKGIAVSIGTDGCASNNNLDLFAEMDTTAKLAKVANLDPAIIDARTVLAMATIGGARAIGLENRIGTIEPGKKADIIIVDAHSPHMTPMYNPYSQLVYSATGGDVRDVIINGNIVYRDRRFTNLDSAEIMNEVTRLCRRITV